MPSVSIQCIGCQGVGITSFLNRLISNRYSDQPKATHGLELQDETIDSCDVEFCNLSRLKQYEQFNENLYQTADIFAFFIAADEVENYESPGWKYIQAQLALLGQEHAQSPKLLIVTKADKGSVLTDIESNIPAELQFDSVSITSAKDNLLYSKERAATSGLDDSSVAIFAPALKKVSSLEAPTTSKAAFWQLNPISSAAAATGIALTIYEVGLAIAAVALSLSVTGFGLGIVAGFALIALAVAYKASHVKGEDATPTLSAAS